MSDKGWKCFFEIRQDPGAFTFGLHLEAYRWVTGWPSIRLTISFWHRDYHLWLRKMGED